MTGPVESSSSNDPVARCQLPPPRAYRTQVSPPQRSDMSRHHEHLDFPAETLGAPLRLLSRGPRVNPRVVSFLTTRSKLESCRTRARVDPRVFYFFSLLLPRCVYASPSGQLGGYFGKTLSQTVPSAINCTGSSKDYHVANCRHRAFRRVWGSGLSGAWGGQDQPARRSQRASCTLKRTPAPSGRLAAEASPPWNSAMRRTM